LASRAALSLAVPARERALEALNDSRPREAVLRLRRYLRDAVTGASWEEEDEACRFLASALEGVGELALAGWYLVHGGAAREARQLGDRAADADIFLEVGEPEAYASYWTRAALFNLIAGQADVVPDDRVSWLAEQALAVLDEADAGRLIDSPFRAPSVYLAAVDALSELADRLHQDAAARLLRHLQARAETRPGTYHYTEEAHQIACVRIGRTHPELADEALTQLVGLLGRNRQLSNPAATYLKDRLEGVSAKVEQLAATGHQPAVAFLAWARPTGPTESEAQVAEAACRRRSPTARNASRSGREPSINPSPQAGCPPNGALR
jgi:hypothetical protein